MEMKNTTYFALVLLLSGSLMACTAGADAGDGKAGLLGAFKPEPEVTLPSGTRLRVVLIDGVSTNGSSVGDQFMASLADPVLVDEKVVLEKGTKVRGRVTDVQESGRVKGVASIRLILTDIVHEGDNVEISTKPFAAAAETTKKRDAGVIAGGAGAGAVIGAIAGGKQGAGVGALIGGGAGTGAVLATKGKELHYPPETRLTFTLSAPVGL
jgi:hypothetical protein